VVQHRDKPAVVNQPFVAGNFGANRSAHPFGSCIGAWYFRSLAGIRPDLSRPGFKHVVLKPMVVGDLKFAEASYDSMYGRIAVKCRRDGQSLQLAHLFAAVAEDIGQTGPDLVGPLDGDATQQVRVNLVARRWAAQLRLLAGQHRCLFLPASGLGRVDAEQVRDLGGCVVRLDGLYCDLGLQAGRVILAGSGH
jgi:hypothetical protein